MSSHFYSVKVQGVVQGVGFRPFVYRLAEEFSLTGSVRNTGKGVLINLVCTTIELSDFIRSLKKHHLPLAKISSLTWKLLPQTKHFDIFSIEDSSVIDSQLTTQIPPDSAICHDCLLELTDPANRRHNYPFINCTNCGPRFSIIESLPYDRPNTSMKSFPLCEQCTTEYHDPKNRRFHAQPIGCWTCGPSLSWHTRHGNMIKSKNHIAAAIKTLQQGKIVAIKGLGGFHLAVDATKHTAISRLRQRKGRKSKPLAIMVRDLKTAHKFSKINKSEEKLLCSNRAPIVLLKKKAPTVLPENLAPAVAEIGIMLPYTPLHHLLFSNDITALVMTSGNQTGEPICIDNDDALFKLNGIADFFLLHDRDIVTRLDDSLLRFAAGKARILRRSRGYIPEPILIQKNSESLLACGASEKNTFCLTKGQHAIVSQHIGELNTPTSLDFYKESLDHLIKIHKISPKAVCYDLHPDYLSSRYGKNLPMPGSAIQHHHAHAAAVMGEHAIKGPVISVIFDGTGLGPDRTIWGGEILYTTDNSYERLAHIAQMLLPSGDGAAKKPWMMAQGMLWKISNNTAICEKLIARHFPEISNSESSFLLQMLSKNINCPKTSSCGRLFDGVAALIGQRMINEYEGQAAMELEALAWAAIGNQEPIHIIKNTKGYQCKVNIKGSTQLLDITSLIQAIISDKKRGIAKEIIALKFHIWLISIVVKILWTIRQELGQLPIILAGGCMQNRLLLEGLYALLNEHNFTVFAGEKIPMNDAGISFGQAVIGGSRNVSCHTHAGH